MGNLVIFFLCFRPISEHHDLRHAGQYFSPFLDTLSASFILSFRRTTYRHFLLGVPYLSAGRLSRSKRFHTTCKFG